jgi:hypothetical protein
MLVHSCGRGDQVSEDEPANGDEHSSVSDENDASHGGQHQEQGGCGRRAKVPTQEGKRRAPALMPGPFR